MSTGFTPKSRRLSGREVRERLQKLERKLERRPLYPAEEAALEALLAGTYRIPINEPEPRRVSPVRRRAR